MLANVIFYLGGTPRVWHQTHDDEITSWDSFKEKLRELFGDPMGRKVAARKALASRVQTSTEPYVSYILDVLALCRKADDTMSEADKVAHVLKGIADDAFNLLVFGNVSTIDAIIKNAVALNRLRAAVSHTTSRGYPILLLRRHVRVDRVSPPPVTTSPALFVASSRPPVRQPSPRRLPIRLQPRLR